MPDGRGLGRTMRLFIAICFPDNILNALQKTMQDLRAEGVRGNYSRRDNLHLTLAFLGEVDSPERICRTMREVSAPEMELMLQGSGRFRDLYWIGLAENPELTRYAAALREALGSAGIDYDSKPFRPHITMVRRVEYDGRIQAAIPQEHFTVKKISLMKSERTGGRLTYTEIYVVPTIPVDR